MTIEERREKTRLAVAEWRRQHPERAKEANRRWYAAHTDQAKAYQRAYAAAHPTWRRDNSRKHRATHPELEKSSQYRYYHGHKVQQREKARRYEAANREHIAELGRLRYAADLEKARASLRANMKRYRERHPEDCALHNAVARMVRRHDMPKTARARIYVGCSPGFLRNHLESLFRPGMMWENHGAVWHVDHIVPLAWWDLKNHPEHAMIASHYSNLRPLFGAENLSKGARHCA